MSGTASETVWEIIDQKIKYAYKVLSDKSVESNMLTFYNMFDLLSFSFDFILSDTLFSSLLSSIMFGIPLSDVIPANLDFDVELPSVDEFLSGLLIKIIPKSIFETFPELLTLSSLYYNTLLEEIASQLLSQQLEKGIYGKSRYEYAYYDPVAVREFLRSTLYALTKKRSTDETVKARVVASGKTLNIREDVMAYVFNSLQMMTYAKVNACTTDYCWFDVSLFPKEGSEAKVTFIGWDLQPVEAEYASAVDSSGSCWFDNCIFEVNYFAPDEAPTVYIDERAGNLITEASYYIYNKARSRLLSSPFALSNYQKSYERVNPERSIRVEPYGLNRFIVEDVRKTVISLIGEKVPYQYLQNLYVVATLDLIKRLAKPGGWGDEAFRAMSRDEILSYFLDKWGSQGLDKELLQTIFVYFYDSGLIKRYSFIRSQAKYTVKTARGGR